LWLLVTTLGTAQVAPSPQTAVRATPKTILILHSYHSGLDWTDDLDRAIREGLHDSPFDLDFRVEHMDARRYAAEAYLDQFAAYLASKYADLRFDLVITSDDAALDFAVAHHATLLQGAPVVFCGVSNAERAHAVPRESFTGIIEVFSAGFILETALKLHPDRRRVLAIGDNSPTGEVTLHQLAEVAHRRTDVAFRMLDGRAYTLDEIVRTVRDAGAGTIVVASLFARDRDGRYYPRGEANARIAEASQGPVYSPSVTELGQGIVGGSQNTGQRHGASTAALALRVLRGEKPGAIPIAEEKQDYPIFDERQLARWGIDQAELPANAVVVNRPEDIFVRYRAFIWGGLAFSALQTAVIGALVVAIGRRRQAERRVGQQAETLVEVNRRLEALNASLQEEIAERRRAEAEKEQLNVQLHQSQKMEAVGKLAGGIAHDFNNLLSVILGHVEFALEAVQADSRVASDLREVQTAGNRAATLTRQLLAFSRKQLLQPTLIDVSHVTARTAAMLQRIIGEDVQLVQVHAPDLGATLADEAQIEQVLINLVINARDAMPNGGRITLETANVTLAEDAAATVGVPAPGPYIRVSVIDTGIGMTEETRSRVFEPFFTTKAVGRGTGLGLSMAYGIVKQSGGGIAVSSVPGEGARFDVYLPRDQATPGLPLPVVHPE
jgi:signal transduction histidine kinase